jgi:hypothetical protein
MLAAMLKGTARKFFTGLNARDKSDYFVLIDHLRQRFGCQSKHQQFWLSQLDARNRQPGETAATLGDDLLLLARRAYPKGMTDMNLQKLALQQFYKSLEPEMRWRCIEKNCITIDEAVEAVETYETVMGKSNPLRRPVRAALTESAQDDKSKMIQTLADKIDRLEVQLREQRANQANHNALPGRNNNRQPYYNNQRGNNRYPNRDTIESPLPCFICKRTGHYYKECPTFLKCQQMEEQETRCKAQASSQGN